MGDKIGYVGLGAMGAPMLKRLVDNSIDNTVFGFDEDLKKMELVCKEAKALTCKSVAEIAQNVDILFTCLPSEKILEEVYLGQQGIAENIKSGSITVDCSTVGPGITSKIYDHLHSLYVDHLDASMLGSVAQANDGTISFVVGGNKSAFDRIVLYLEALGKMIRYCGVSGAGNKMKLLHQTLVAGHAVAVAEAITLCKQVGSDADIFYEIVTGGTGFAYSRYFQQRVPRIRNEEFSPLFMLKFMLKDARLAREMMGADSEKSCEIYRSLETTIETFEEASVQGFDNLDFSAVIKVLENRIENNVIKSHNPS